MEEEIVDCIPETLEEFFDKYPEVKEYILTMKFLQLFLKGVSKKLQIL